MWGFLLFTINIHMPRFLAPITVAQENVTGNETISGNETIFGVTSGQDSYWTTVDVVSGITADRGTFTTLISTKVIDNIDYNPVTIHTQGTLNYSLVFDGDENSVITFNAATNWGLNDFTIEFFFALNLDPATHFSSFIGTGQGFGNSNCIGIFVGNGNGVLSNNHITVDLYGSGEQMFELPTALGGDGSWHHLALSRSEGYLTLWIDGVRCGYQANTWNVTGFTDALGLHYPSGFNGKLTNIRMTANALYSYTDTTITVPTGLLGKVTGTKLLLKVENLQNAYVDSSDYNVSLSLGPTTTVGAGVPSFGILDNSWYFNTNGNLTIPPSGDIFRDGISVLSGIKIWNSTYSTVCANSAQWGVTTDTNKLSLSGGTLTGGVTGTTALFTTSLSAPAISGTHYGDGSKLTGVIASGGTATDSTKLALTGGTVNGNILINGGLTALSGATFINTTFQDTSALRIYNSGLGPALYVEQAAGSGDIAKFYDADGVEVFHVGNALNPESTGVIGIKTSTPNKTLTINGEVSATSGIWASTYYGDASNLSNVRDTTKLPLSGGTLTGKLDGNDANFSNSLYATTITAVDFIGNGSLLTGVAKLDSPTFVGTPAAPTAPAGTDTTQIATTQFVMQNRGDRYLTTSTTSLALANNQTYSLTAGIGLSYTTSQPITLVHDTTHFMDANVVSYNTNTGAMVINGTSRTGTGTFSAWTINVQSTPVAGGLIAGNNLSDVISPSAALVNLGGFPSSGGTLAGGLTGTHAQFNSITFIPNASNLPYELGKVWYDTNKDALAYYPSVSGNIIHIGQELQQYVRNATANLIKKGDAVTIRGFTDQNPDIILSNSATLTGAIIAGVANQDIPAGQLGYIVTIGQVANFDTSQFNAGDDLFLSPLSAGKITNIMPTNPYFAMQVGICLYSHATNGKMMVYTQYLGTAANTVVGIMGMEQLPTSVGSTVNTVSGLSSKWESVYNSVSSTSANWDSTYSTVCSNSAKWSTPFDQSLNTNNNVKFNQIETAKIIGGNYGANQLSFPLGFGPILAGYAEGNVNIQTGTSDPDNYLTWKFNHSDRSFTLPPSGIIGTSDGSSIRFTNSISSSAISGTFYGDGTRLTGVATLTGTQKLENKTVVDWMTLVRGYNTTPTLCATITTGDVYTYVYNSSPSNVTYYRYIASDGSVDAFYTYFSGSTLTGIVASKSINL